MRDKSQLEIEFDKILDQKARTASEKYIGRLDELVKEYETKDTVDDKKKIIAEIEKLSEGYKSLKGAYLEAKETFYHDIEFPLSKQEGFFEARLAGRPHEWDAPDQSFIYCDNIPNPID